jgi:hypothetical protein
MTPMPRQREDIDKYELVSSVGRARAAGLLAVAALGLVVVAGFDRVVDGELATMSLPDSVAKIVAAERGKLVAADFSDIAAPTEHNAGEQGRLASAAQAWATRATLLRLGNTYDLDTIERAPKGAGPSTASLLARRKSKPKRALTIRVGESLSFEER